MSQLLNINFEKTRSEFESIVQNAHGDSIISTSKIVACCIPDISVRSVTEIHFKLHVWSGNVEKVTEARA